MGNKNTFLNEKEWRVVTKNNNYRLLENINILEKKSKKSTSLAFFQNLINNYKKNQKCVIDD